MYHEEDIITCEYKENICIKIEIFGSCVIIEFERILSTVRYLIVYDLRPDYSF